VGCGLITATAHLPAALRSSKIDVVALIDSTIDTARTLARSFALNCTISDTLHDVIDHVDGVLIATPNHSHYPLARVALEKHVPVLIEKPLTTTYADAIELCELARKNTTVISVGYKTRHFPSVRLLKRLLANGWLGRINRFHYECGSRGGWQPVSGYNIDREKSGGGVLVVSGAHFLDRMLYWFGAPAQIRYRDDSYGGVEANCKADLVFDSGAGTFAGTFFMSKTVQLRNTFTLDTEKYRCELPETESEHITVVPHTDTGLTMELFSHAADKHQASRDYFQVQLEEFADTIHGTGRPTVDGWSGARSIKLIEEMYRDRAQLDEPWRIYPRTGAPTEHA